MPVPLELSWQDLRRGDALIERRVVGGICRQLLVVEVQDGPKWDECRIAVLDLLSGKTWTWSLQSLGTITTFDVHPLGRW